MDKKWRRSFVLDVESDGPSPLDYNMISFGLVNVFDPTLSFGHIVAPLHQNGGGLPEARKVCGVSWERQNAQGLECSSVLSAAQRFLVDTAEVEHVTIWSDNPAFDWQFWNAYVWRFCGSNVAGFSARRIGDLDAGRRKAPFNTNAWKKWRVTAHTHDPVDDARGNVEALRRIIAEMEQ